MKRLLFAPLVLAAFVVSPVAGVAAERDFAVGDTLSADAGDARQGFRDVSWDDLIPPDWIPEDLFAELFDDSADEIEDFDPRAVAIMEKIREEWDRAPIVPRLDGQRIRIPGFVVPLEGDAEEIQEFLLVPYFGACIHVPPPPANQLIHVMPDDAIPARWNMTPVWVSGVMSVARYASDMGTAGYQLRAIEVEEYRE